jgi:predicted RNA-binding protein YlxR (DUF448 family)
LLKQRKIPMRMCVGCRQMFPKKELMRVVRSPEEVISFDRVGKAPGRGAYLCRRVECLNKAMKIRALERQLECSISPEVFEQLAGELAKEEA